MELTLPGRRSAGYTQIKLRILMNLEWKIGTNGWLIGELVKVDGMPFWSKESLDDKGWRYWMLLAFMLLNHHKHTLKVASMYLFAFKFQAICSCTILVWCHFLQKMVKSNHLNSELGSSSSAAHQFFSAQIQGVQGKTAYWGKGKWRTDTWQLRKEGSLSWEFFGLKLSLVEKKKVAHWWNE